MSAQTATPIADRPAPRAGFSRSRMVGLVVDVLVAAAASVVTWMLYPAVLFVALIIGQYAVLAWMCWRIGGRTPGMYVVRQLFWRRDVSSAPTEGAAETWNPAEQGGAVSPRQTGSDRAERVAEAGFASAAPSRFRQEQQAAPTPRRAPAAAASEPEVLPSPVATDAPTPRQPIPFTAQEPQEETIVPAPAAPAEETVIPAPSRAQWVLEMTDGERIDLGERPVVLGRKPFQPEGIAAARLVTVPDDTRMVSRAHCVIQSSAISATVDAPNVTDLGSANGTTVERAGEQRVLGADESMQLESGDVLLLGNHRLIVR